MSAEIVTLVRSAGGGVVCERCVVAASPLRRLRGLLGRTSLPAGEGILLKPARSVHTFFMRFPIDVVFVDSQLAVLSIAAALPPWRTAAERRAFSVLELAAGECERRCVAVGDVLLVRATSEPGRPSPPP
jgi:uncharacterized membrane protein (UPF0127 family)